MRTLDALCGRRLESVYMSSLFLLLYAQRRWAEFICSFSATPSKSLSYTLFTPGSYRAKPQYYTVGSEWFHLEQLGIKHLPQEQLAGKMREEKLFLSPYSQIFSVNLGIRNSDHLFISVFLTRFFTFNMCYLVCLRETVTWGREHRQRYKKVLQPGHILMCKLWVWLGVRAQNIKVY